MKNKRPLISVIMSVYNAEFYLDTAIKSILNQTYKNIEFIIVNDGSMDKSLEIINKYMIQDKRIVLIDHQNIGLTKSLNKAIKIANGKYIARQDADDESILNRFEKQLYLLERYNLDFVVSRAIKNKKIAPKAFLLNFNKEEIFKAGNIFIHGTFFAKKEVFKNIMYDEKYIYAQDFKFIVDCFRKNINIGYIKEPLYILNDMETNISNTKKDEQDKSVSNSLLSYFGDDKYFLFINKQYGIKKKVLKILILIFMQIRGCAVAYKNIK
jgi:glycosyltransferase involved in cell wall biosynthesis